MIKEAMWQTDSGLWLASAGLYVVTFVAASPPAFMLSVAFGVWSLWLYRKRHS